MIVTENSTDVTTYFHLRLAADGTDATSLTITNIDLQYTRSGATPAAKVDATALGAANSAHGDNQAIEIDGTDQPGVYRVDWPDAAFASGVRDVVLTVKCATVFTESLRVQLVSATRGLAGTALPNAAADAAGGLPISDAGGLDLDAQVGTDIDNLVSRLGTPSNLGGGATVAANLADIEAQTDDIGAAGAGLTALATAAALATVDTVVDAILVDTAEIGTAGAGLTDVGGLSTAARAQVKAEADDALTDYAGATSAELASVDAKIDILDTNVDAILVDTGTTLQAEIDGVEADVDTLLSRLGTPSNLGGGATVAANLSDIEGQTDDIGAAGAGLTALASAANLATLDGKVDTIDNLLDTEIPALTAAIQGLMLTSGTIGATGNSTTALHLAGLAYADDAINSMLLSILDVSTGLYYARWIEDWANTGDLATVALLPFTPEASVDKYWLLPVRADVTGGSGLDAAGVRAAIGLASANLDTQLGDLPTNAELATSQAAADDATLAAIAALNNLSSAGAQSAAAAALASYDGPTNAEMEARTLAAASYATAAALTTVDTVVDAVLAMLDDPRSEPGQGAPAVNADLATKIDYLYKWTRNKKDNNGSVTNFYADNGSTVDQKQTTSEAGGTVTKGEIVTGA